jgi:hypothetical protein
MIEKEFLISFWVTKQGFDNQNPETEHWKLQKSFVGLAYEGKDIVFRSL